MIEQGAYPAKAFVGERLPIRATVFREGHDAVRCAVQLTGPDGRTTEHLMKPCEPKGFDRWEAWVRPDATGPWRFHVEAWDDPWHTWVHHAEIKIPAGIDTALVCAEGVVIFTAAAERATAAGDGEAAASLTEAARALAAPSQVEDRLALVLTDEIDGWMERYAPRPLLTRSETYELFTDRRAAGFAAWYEFFPRSQGATQQPDGSWRSGTFASSYERLEAAAAMGFDVVYLPPIHPIGTAHRKGPNNTLTPGPHDPGSPWAIGAAEGGHDTIHPDLGDFDDFDAFVARAKELGLEVALDLALQASPDHPWVRDHREWFTERVDGTIAYAENPPKKYQDIYPINFDRDPDGIYAEVLRVVRLWIDHGVRIFRVDNPHTKPLDFWAWLLAEVRRTDPDVIFLAEAFTRPEMMQLLGKIGYQQSYSYFTWRNTAEEIEEYLTELSTVTDAFMRPNFFVNTPDINPTFLQHGGRPAFVIRAVLGATLVPVWGVYSGFELYENEPLRIGGEEYLNSEKYEYRPRDFAGALAAGDSLQPLLTRLNAIRRAHPALQQLRDVHFHDVASDGEMIVFSKRDVNPDGSDDTVIVVCSLDPHRDQVVGEVTLDMARLGLAPTDSFTVFDALGDARWTWGARNYVRLTPDRPAHVLVVSRAATP
ncbi:alpha-1,4-glucan--maltose-1-phosphate maltosyltransferase [Propionibacteriaceae bacterium Y2011]